MTKLTLKFTLVLLTLFSVPVLSQESANVPVKYELKLIYILENKDPEFIFVIGDSGFKSIESLKKFLGGLPSGSEITWNPGCERFGREPLLSSEKEMKSFRTFLEEKGVKFKLIPAG